MRYSPETQVVRDLRGRLPDFSINWDRAALLIVDMQYIDAHPDYGYGLKAKQEGSFATLQYYFDRLSTLVVPNLQALISLFRGRQLPVIYLRIGCHRQDGADTSWRYKQFHLFAPPGSRERDILDEIAPEVTDIVVEKTTSSGFISTNLHQLLTNLGVSSLVISGVATNGCVESTVRGAGDLGYLTYLVEDACAAFKPELHEESIRDMDHNFALVTTTRSVVQEAEAHSRDARRSD
jgi:ureidoacrylate peracid hydrolase